MKIQKCRKKSHHFLTLWPWPLTYDLEKLIRSGHYHYQCVYPNLRTIHPVIFSYRVNTIAGGGRRAAGGGRLRRKTITSPDPSDTGDIISLKKKVTYICISSVAGKQISNDHLKQKGQRIQNIVVTPGLYKHNNYFMDGSICLETGQAGWPQSAPMT